MTEAATSCHSERSEESALATSAEQMPRFARHDRLWLLLVGLLLVWLGRVAPAWSQDNRVGLVVQFGNGAVFRGCYPYSQGMTGADLLRQAGLDTAIEYSGQGAFVCRISAAGVGQDGCDYPHEACQCQAQTLPWRYWAYWRLDGAEWTYSDQGAAGRMLQPGSVDGWAWGAGGVTSAVKPPPVTWQDLCAAATPRSPDTPTQIGYALPAQYAVFGGLVLGLGCMWWLVRRWSRW